MCRRMRLTSVNKAIGLYIHGKHLVFAVVQKLRLVNYYVNKELLQTVYGSSIIVIIFMSVHSVRWGEGVKGDRTLF